MKISRATNQPEGTIIIENIVSMSQDLNIPVTVITKSGAIFTGVIINMTHTANFFSGKTVVTDRTQLLLRADGIDYSFIRYSEVEAITFQADEDVFDEMLK